MFVLQTLLLKRISGYNFNALEKQLGVSKIERVPLERINTDAVMKPLQRHVTNLADVVGHGYEKRVALPGIEIDIATNLKKMIGIQCQLFIIIFSAILLKKKIFKNQSWFRKIKTILVAFLLVGNHSFTELSVRAMYVCPEFTAPLMGARWIAKCHTEGVVIFCTSESTETKERTYYSLLTLLTNLFLSKRVTKCLLTTIWGS